MKLRNSETSSMELMEMLEELYQQEQEFWRDVERYVTHGVPAADEKGHWLEIRVRVRPNQMDLITALREKHPPGFYKSQADLIRALLSAGCKTHFELFKRKKSAKWGELEQILDGLNIIGKQHRLQELKTDVRKAMNAAVSSPSTPEDRAKVINLLSELDKKVNNL